MYRHSPNVEHSSKCRTPTFKLHPHVCKFFRTSRKIFLNVGVLHFDECCIRWMSIQGAHNWLIYLKAIDTLGEYCKYSKSRPSPQRGLGHNPSRGLGQTPAAFLRRSRPRFGLEPQLPAYMIQSSQPVLSAVERVVKFVWTKFGGWAVRARIASEPERSEDRRPPIQIGFRKIWRGSGETKPVARLNPESLKSPPPPPWLCHWH